MLGRARSGCLEALRANRPQRGRKRTPAAIQQRLASIEVQLADADAMAELRLVQERRDLEQELQAFDGGVDVAALEAEFVKRRQELQRASWH